MIVVERADDADGGARRVAGDNGSGLVAAITILFSLTFLSLVWLARDVDRGVSNEGAAEAIAFQAARSGAQAASIAGLRTGAVVVDESRAQTAALATASQLFDSYGVDGSVTAIEIDPATRRLRVTVRVDDGPVSVIGTGIVTVEVTP